MWETMDELIEALSGEWGEEEQQAALDFAEESGLLDEWAAHEEAEEAGGYDQALEEEFQRVESQIGRKLTAGEEQGILDSISPSERAQGTIPNMVTEFGDTLANARNHEAGRVHLGEEAAQRVFDEQIANGEREGEPGGPQPVFEAPVEGDY
jgi:hypothetical protein